MGSNTYKISGPALISFSGGRTSGFMLWQILAAHGGRLPDDVHVLFANTGKERNETLDFVDEVERRWGVPVVWLEFRRAEVAGEPDTFAVVDFLTASRDGQPFADLIAKKSYLPNAVTRFCTSELKIRPMKKYMLARGYSEWDSVLGLRADEPRRVQRASLSAARERWTNVMPMSAAGHGLADVMSFWRSQSFDLQLNQEEGNCDLCFLKATAKLGRIINRHPEKADWWIDQEFKVGGTFNSRRSYSHLLRVVNDKTGQYEMFVDDGLDVCNCTD